ncbi:hypothetical protein SDJN03_02653, partial [Cucurbita argyrosperma subsp. sororia]
METQKKEEDNLTAPASSSGFLGKLEEKYKELKENAETYPYVWGSYIVVYGGFALWTGYRWRKLRKTEDRVRALQEKLRQRYEAEQSAKQSANSVASVEKVSQSVKQPPSNHGKSSCFTSFPIDVLQHKEPLGGDLTIGRSSGNWWLIR